jgi:hypothetical protein
MFAFTIVALVLASSVTRGAEPVTLETCAAAIESQAAEPDGDRVVVGHLSRQLGISVETLRQQRAQTALGWGDLLIANHLAAATGLTFEQTVTEYRTGKTWSEVAESHAIEVAELLKYVQEAEDAIEERSDDKGRTGRSESAPTRSTGGGRGGGGRRRPIP